MGKTHVNYFLPFLHFDSLIPPYPPLHSLMKIPSWYFNHDPNPASTIENQCFSYRLEFWKESYRSRYFLKAFSIPRSHDSSFAYSYCCCFSNSQRWQFKSSLGSSHTSSVSTPLLRGRRRCRQSTHGMCSWCLLSLVNE